MANVETIRRISSDGVHAVSIQYRQTLEDNYYNSWFKLLSLLKNKSPASRLAAAA